MLTDLIPPPGGTLDWHAWVHRFPDLRALDGCPQEPRYHAEGDVAVHTRMVCEALVADDRWRQLPRQERDELFLAALFHDIGKPACTRCEGGRITSRGHARVGAQQVRRLLWDELSLESRERVVALVRWHGLPLFGLEREDPVREVLRASVRVRNDLLALLAAADVAGRQCEDADDLLLRLALFEELCREQQAWDAPYPFANATSRYEFFQRPGRDPTYAAWEAPRLEVTLLAGLPASGKDTWIRSHAADRAVVSLDDVRRRLRIDPTDIQAAVVRAARTEAQALLREGRSFIWNATNVTTAVRAPLIAHFASLGAAVRIVYLEASLAQLQRRNQSREHPVPAAVIHRLWEKLEVPDLTEAHSVQWVRTDS